MQDNSHRPGIPEGRRLAYYVGKGLTVLGLLVFLSSFVSLDCGSRKETNVFPGMDPSSFGKNVVRMQDESRSRETRAITGIILLIAGSVISKIGSRGLAGSGVILDPEKAREDLKPWNKMAGGMLDDTLSEVKPIQKIVDHLTEEHDAVRTAPQVIKVRCRGCNALNDKDACFCDQCGGQL
jgi:hypothetical protein